MAKTSKSRTRQGLARAQAAAAKGRFVRIASIPLLFIGGWAGYGIQQAANLAVPMTMLKFSSQFEEDADFLGVQYMYKAGYDPVSIVQFFERLKAKEKKKKKLIAKAFSSHPMTRNRIKRVQGTINELLPEQPEYAVSSSDFDDVKERLAGFKARRKPEENDPNRPTLKRSTNDAPIPSEEIDADEDERPRTEAADLLACTSNADERGSGTSIGRVSPAIRPTGREVIVYRADTHAAVSASAAPKRSSAMSISDSLMIRGGENAIVSPSALSTTPRSRAFCMQ